MRQFSDHTIIRHLDSLEEFFWLLRTPGPYRYVCAMTVEGRTTVQGWRTAWQAIHPIYDVLTASIVKRAGKRPAFVRTGCESYLSVLSGSSPPEANLAMAVQLNDDTHVWAGALIRATLFHHSDRSLFVLTAHHSGSDGNTCLAIFRSLLQALTGQLKPSAVKWISSSEFVGRPTPTIYRYVLPTRTVLARRGDEGAELPLLVIQSAVLDTQATKNLILAAKVNGSTVHSALMVALALAMQPHIRRVGREFVRCSTPINIRPLTDAGSTAGVLISMYVGDVTMKHDETFWDSARRVQKELRAERELANVQGRVERLNRMMVDELTPDTLAAKLSDGSFAKDLTLTNLGNKPLQSEYGELRVSSLSCAVHSGKADAQTICTHTLNHRLTLTQVSRQPIPDLLEQTIETLTRAS